MKHRIAIGVSLAVALLVGGVIAAEAIKSGPQPGSSSIPPFNPLHCNGPTEGQKLCLVWKNGDNPVAMIFAREISGPLTSLVKKIDSATVKNSSCSMGSFVVFLSDEEDLDRKLKDLSKKQDLKELVLTIDNPAGPRGYNVTKEADVTVVLYTGRNVKANYAFRKGELKDSDVDKIVADLKKILP